MSLVFKVRLTTSLRFNILIPFILMVFVISCSPSALNNDKGTSDVVSIQFLNSMERVGLDEDPGKYANNEYLVKGAKDEIVSFQFNIHSLKKNIQVLQVEVSDLKGEEDNIIKREEISFYREAYLPIRESSPKANAAPGLIADALVPLKDPYDDQESFGHRIAEIPGLPFEIWQGQNQPIWVDIQIPDDAKAGRYEGEISLSFHNAPVQREDAGEMDTLSFPFSLEVWDFSIKDVEGIRNHFGEIEGVNRSFKMDEDSDEFRKIAQRYRAVMSKNAINPPLPKELLPVMKGDGHLEISEEKTEQLKDFISKFGVLDFPIPMPHISYESLIGIDKQKGLNYFSDYEKFIEQNGWSGIGYVYMYDEPNSAEEYETVLALGNLIKEAAPTLKRLVVEQTYTENPDWVDIDPAVDIWCPLFSFIDKETINEKIENGDEVWSYTALSQQTPAYSPIYDSVKFNDPPYWHIDNHLSAYRVPTWLNWQYDITGLLYWSTIYGRNVWLRPAFRHEGFEFNGEGLLIYPGLPCNINGPIESLRLKNIRDGMNDYKYFKLLEQHSDKEHVSSFVSKIVSNWWDIDYDSGSILSAKELLAKEIIDLSK